MSGEVILEEFQSTAQGAVTRLIKKKLLGASGGREVLLKAPTGAGKTVIAGAVISDLAADDAFDVCFVWIAPFRLQQQSLRSLRRVLGSAQKLSEKDQIASAKYIQPGEVVFLNWSSLNKDEAQLIRGSESRDAFKEICTATHTRGTKIVVVIDESHHTSGTKIAGEIKEMIAPDVILEMSATPDVKRIDASHEVPRDEVVDAGLIKKAARINDGITDGTKYTAAKLDTLLIDLAVQKRNELVAAYASEGADVNPLLLIQVPDGAAGEAVIADLERRLDRKHKLTYRSGRLARWLSDDATVPPEDPSLVGNDGTIEALIFKQAIATGWDCPRAHVLLKLRDPGKSAKFEVQTIGRIMRMPERKHYVADQLNEAFVYHPHEEYKPAEDFAIVTREACWKAEIPKPTLPSAWLTRGVTPFIGADDAKALVRKALENLGVDPDGKPSANQRKLKRAGLDIDAVPEQSLVEGLLDGEDDDAIEKLGDAQVGLPAKLIERVFHRLIARWIGVAQNPGLVAEALYDACAGALDFGIAQTQTFFVANEGDVSEEFVAGVDAVVPRASRSTRVRHDGDWVPQDPRPYNTEVGKDLKHDEVTTLDGCAYEPCFLAANRSRPERDFEDWLSGETGDVVAWWFKNGERVGQDFSLVYSLGGTDHNFFPDYIVGLTDGRVALCETKDVKEAFIDDPTECARNEAKMEALRQWINADTANRAGAFVVEAATGGLRWGLAKPPVETDGQRMKTLFA